MKSKQTRKENKTSPAKIAANKRYNDNKTDVLQCRVKKSENINQRIDDAIRGTNTSKAAFILDAIRAKLDGPQPVQVPQPQPDTTPATAAATVPDQYGMELLRIPLPTSMQYNERIAEAVYNGAAKSEKIFVMQALDRRLHEADMMMK